MAPAVPVRGSGKEVGELPKVECTYGNCSKRFNTVKEMKRHKLDEPEHNYCKKCDVDCEYWEDLTLHKVEAMLPWLSGKANTDEAPTHIVCEFCGEDFKSFGGRKRHRMLRHQAEQDIQCPGLKCGARFTSAGGLVEHLEKGQCSKITRSEFVGSVQQKHIAKQILENPEHVASMLNQSEAVNPGGAAESISQYTEDNEEGGVALLDQEDEEQKGGHPAMRPEVDLIDMNAPIKRSDYETWPRLPGQPPSQISVSMKSLSIRSSVPSSVEDENNGDDDDHSSQTTTTPVYQHHPTVWNGKTSQALFKDAKPMPPTLKDDNLEDESVVDEGTNLFHNRFWDPSSRDWNPKNFLNPLTDKFCCVFEGCDYAQYETLEELMTHLRQQHIKSRYSCPRCFKEFRSAAALIQHADTSLIKCRVKFTPDYAKLLDEVSGGFLKAKEVRQPKVYNLDRSLVKACEQSPAWGYMSHKYESKLPNEK